MPKIPVYNAERNINANPIAPQRHEVDQSFQNTQTVIGAVKNVTQQWSNANDVMQYTEAKSKYETASADISARANADPNFRNSETYSKELEKAKQESVTGIANQEVANKAAMEFDYNNKITGIKIDAGFKQKQIVYNKVQVKNSVDLLQQKRISSSTSAESTQYDHQIEQILQANVDSGVLTYQEGIDFAYNSNKRAMENLVYSNPQAGLKALENNTQLTEKDKYSLIEEAHQIEKRDKEFQAWQLKQTQTQGTVELSDALFNKSLSPTMVRDMQQKGLIDSETAAIFDSLAIDKKYDIPESTSLGQPEYFLRLLEDTHGEKVEVNKILKDAATSYAEGKLGVNQYRYFIQSAKETFDRQSKGIFTPSKEQNAVKSALDGIQSFAKSTGGAVEGMFVKFFDRFKPGEDPNVIKSQVINEKVLEDKPEVSAFPSDGKLMIDKNGNKAMVFPDGHIEEIK